MQEQLSPIQEALPLTHFLMNCLEDTEIVDVKKPKDNYESLLNSDGSVAILPWKIWQKYDRYQICHFCSRRAIYTLPTDELLDLLSELIDPNEFAVEICAGLGIIGRDLGLTLTDSKMQNDPGIQAAYALIGNATPDYPDDVETFEALEAADHYQPDCILSCFGTPKYSEERMEALLEKWEKEGVPVKERTRRAKRLGGSIVGVDYPELIKKVKHLIVVTTEELFQNSGIMHIKHKVHTRAGLYSRTLTPLKVYEWILD